jgi:hypothetical protein
MMWAESFQACQASVTHDDAIFQFLYLLLAAVATWFAVKLSSAFIRAQRESPVSFNVPAPAELSPDWQGKRWKDLKGNDKAVLEDQARGVSAT